MAHQVGVTTEQRLSDTAEFPDLVRAAASQMGMLPEFVEKDYWVTRVLQSLATDPSLASRIIFKGGTSLSKGWNLIDRFSEDIDILMTGDAFGAPPGKGDRARALKGLETRILATTPLVVPDLANLAEAEKRFWYVRGKYNITLRFSLPGYKPATTGPSAEWLLVEAGYRGGTSPHQSRPLRSIICAFLDTLGSLPEALKGCEADTSPFEMMLLSPERTLSEKLLALHSDMIDGTAGAEKVRTRHYYDIAQLFEKSPDVAKAIEAGEIPALVRDAATASNEYFGAQFDLNTLDIAGSPALNPTQDQIRILAAAYNNALESALYYRGVVSFTEILESIKRLAAALRRS